MGILWIYPKPICSIYRLNHSANIQKNLTKSKYFCKNKESIRTVCRNRSSTNEYPSCSCTSRGSSRCWLCWATVQSGSLPHCACWAACSSPLPYCASQNASYFRYLYSSHIFLIVLLKERKKKKEPKKKRRKNMYI